MATLGLDASSLRGLPRGTVVGRAAKRIAAAYRAWQNRRAFYRLGELSDVELHDIGLSRGDLSVAVTFGSDPTRHLDTIAEIRREKMEPFGATRV